ncbi:MAG: glycerate kinase [Lachnospiraceae bacterium]|nr:glycerate kinase [Lachnospiraceae bacterium]
MSLRKDAEQIIRRSIDAVLPDVAVADALSDKDFGSGRVVLVSVGKAAWQMARAAYDTLGNRIDAGIVITKYDHVKGRIADFEMVEAGHPVPDENSFAGTEKALSLVNGLGVDDTVLFLLSGGGSALFEKPRIAGEELGALTEALLASGADIVEMNTIRKRLSAVKGGRFALACAPAKVYAVVLSDIIGDPLDMIASGPAYPDSSTCEDAKRIVEKYQLSLSKEARRCLEEETPKALSNVETVINGSVRQLVAAAGETAKEWGYEPVLLTDCLSCEASEAGSFLGAIAKTHQDAASSLAFIAGGETVVHLKGNGKGGRNQELALAGGLAIRGLKDTAIFSVGSDGTDGPTDAAGGYMDGESISDALLAKAQKALSDNNAYPFLKETGGLIKTGPTGTNVNDVAVLLIKRQ